MQNGNEKLNEVRYKLGREILKTKPKSTWSAEDFQNIKYFQTWRLIIQLKAGRLPEDLSLTAQKRIRKSPEQA